MENANSGLTVADCFRQGIPVAHATVGVTGEVDEVLTHKDPTVLDCLDFITQATNPRK